MRNEEDILESITLRDIERMIKILEKFIKLSKRAERLMSSYARYTRPEYEIARMLLGGSGLSLESSSEEVELSDKEIETLKKIRLLDKK